MRCVTYGCGRRFEPDRFRPVRNRPLAVKPEGGLWSSPVGSAWGWADWCRREDFHVASLGASFQFVVRGRVLTVDSASDLVKLPDLTPPDRGGSFAIGTWAVDFEALVTQGFAAIHLTALGEAETRFSRPRSLYGWDCESVLILDTAAVCPVAQS